MESEEDPHHHHQDQARGSPDAHQLETGVLEVLRAEVDVLGRGVPQALAAGVQPLAVGQPQASPGVVLFGEPAELTAHEQTSRPPPLPAPPRPAPPPGQLHRACALTYGRRCRGCASPACPECSSRRRSSDAASAERRELEDSALVVSGSPPQPRPDLARTPVPAPFSGLPVRGHSRCRHCCAAQVSREVTRGGSGDHRDGRRERAAPGSSGRKDSLAGLTLLSPTWDFFFIVSW